MGSKHGPHFQASLRCGTGAATGWSSCSSFTVWPEAKKKPAARAARKPKRTSFPCLECSKTFPTQQAMAGHCSAHTRAGAGARTRKPAGCTNNHLPAAAAPVVVTAAAAPFNPLPQPPQRQHNVNTIQSWCRQVQVSPRTIPMPMPMPPLAIRYVPYARPASNQMMARLPYLDPHGRRSIRTLAFRPAAGPMPNQMPASGRLGWRAFVPIYGVPPPFSMIGAPPGDAASSTDRPRRRTRADLTLRLGSGREHGQKRTLPLLGPLMVSDGHQQQGAGSKCKLVTSDGGDQGRNKGKDQNQMGSLDLELRLCP